MAVIDAEVEESRARFRARVMAVLCEDLDDEDELKLQAQRAYAAYVEADQAADDRCGVGVAGPVDTPSRAVRRRLLTRSRRQKKDLQRVPWMSVRQWWLGGLHWPQKWTAARCQTRRLSSAISTGVEPGC